MVPTRQLTLGAALLTTGLISGFFYAYACSVTLGLARLPDTQYVLAMQEINATVRNPVFAFSYFGAAIALLLAFFAHLKERTTVRFWLIAAASLLYIGGGFLLTLGVNVSLNETLATVNAASPEVNAARAAYEAPWNIWNWVRTGFSTAALLALIGAALVPETRRRSHA